MFDTFSVLSGLCLNDADFCVGNSQKAAVDLMDPAQSTSTGLGQKLLFKQF